MALTDRLTEAIQNQRAEIARMKETHRTELEKATARLAALQGAKAALTPEIDAVLGQLAAVGIEVKA